LDFSLEVRVLRQKLPRPDDSRPTIPHFFFKPALPGFDAGNEPDSSTESFLSASLRFRGLFFAIPRRRIRFERPKQTSRDRRYLIDSRHERGFVRLRRFVEAADFSDELERSGANLFLSNRRLEIEKYFYVSAHFAVTSISRAVL
jgi:hypothetical protein